MKWHRLRASAAWLGVVLVSLVSCGGDAKSPAPRGGQGGSGGSGVAGTGGSSGSALDASAAGTPGLAGASGLSTRPVNTTCVPPKSIDAPAEKLSATGCVDPTDPRKPSAGLIPYDVNSPLWSDGAAKQRFLALPEGARIHVKNCTADSSLCGTTAAATTEDDGHFGLPVGSVAVKVFALAGKLVETRLLVRFSEQTWIGYSYEWNEEQTDATIVPNDVGGKDKTVMGDAGPQVWHYPSRAQCQQCHTKAAGVSLGLTTAQLDRTFDYGGASKNQLAAWRAIGLFDNDVPSVPALIDPSQSAGTVEQRARSYMQANCAICHRPSGNFPEIDLRAGTVLKDMHVCNEAPTKDPTKYPGAVRLRPGKPTESTMSLRMRAAGDDGARMPQIGRTVLDPVGTRVVDAWISSLTSCN